MTTAFAPGLAPLATRETLDQLLATSRQLVAQSDRVKKDAVKIAEHTQGLATHSELSVKEAQRLMGHMTAHSEVIASGSRISQPTSNAGLDDPC